MFHVKHFRHEFAVKYLAVLLMLTPSQNFTQNGCEIIWRDWESDLPKNLARLVYFDEAGTGGEPVTTVAAVIIGIDDQMPRINAAVRKLRNSLTAYRFEEFEFKADRMFSHFRKFREESRYAPILRGFLQIMRDAEVSICHCAVNNIKYEHANPFGQLSAKRFAFVASTIFVAAWLRENANGEGALCIADPSPDDKIVDGVIRELRAQGIPDRNIASLDQIVETLLIVGSKKSLGLQMSDHANFFLKMHHMRDELAEPFYQIIEPLVVNASLPMLFDGQ